MTTFVTNAVMTLMSYPQKSHLVCRFTNHAPNILYIEGLLKPYGFKTNMVVALMP